MHSSKLFSCTIYYLLSNSQTWCHGMKTMLHSFLWIRILINVWGGGGFIKAALSFVSVHKHLIRMWIPSICFNLSCSKLRHWHVQINQSMEMLEFKSAEQRHTIKYFLYINNTSVPINWCIIPWDYALLKLMVTAVVSQSTGHSFPDLFLQVHYFK